MGRWTGLVSSLMVCALIANVADAADLQQSIRDAEGRKRTAENGVRSIKAKDGARLEELRTLYSDTVTAHNEWLDATILAMNQGASSEAVHASADKAAASFVQWVAARNAALGEPVLAGALATSIQAQTRQGLVDVALEAVRNVNRGKAKKRADLTKDLDSRLRWKAWDEL